jgi:phage I-like protein
MHQYSQPTLLLADGAKDAPSAFRLFAKGINPTAKGDIIVDDAGNLNLIERFKQQGNDLPIDVAHGMLGGATPDAHHAYGWFRPEIRDGDVWAGSVEWTERGRKAVVAREFRYFSPAVLVDDQKRLVGLINLALTNLPATKNLAPLMASQVSLSLAEQADAQRILSQVEAALTASERETCAKFGISEADYVAERNRQLEQALPGWHPGLAHGISAEEAKTATACGLSLEEFAAAKKLAG